MVLIATAVFAGLFFTVRASQSKGRKLLDDLRGDFIPDHLGNLSPYHSAPVAAAGLSPGLPESCSVSQVMLMHRHGSRFPLASELTSITALVNQLTNATAALTSNKAKRSLPDELQFLTKGYKSLLGHDDLSPVGRQELFDSGVAMRLTYPALTESALPINVLAGGQDRVIESAQWFQQGFFGRYANVTSSFSIIAEDAKTASWITPMNTCPKWQYAYGDNKTVEWGNRYLPRITSRLNAIFRTSLPSTTSLVLTDTTTHGALYACAYDLAYLGSLDSSPWCGVFTNQEILNFEYELDLLMEGAFGYGLPDQMGAVLGSLLVQKVVERFTNVTGDADPVYLEFGHDTTIDMALTALGLAKDTPPLSASVQAPSSNRKWRTSSQVPFAARMVWEKFTCSDPSSGFVPSKPYIRLVLNNSPLSLSSVCRSSRSLSRYGACTLDDFVGSSVVKKSLSTVWGGEAWNATCGNSPI